MRKKKNILILLLFFPLFIYGQDTISVAGSENLPVIEVYDQESNPNDSIEAKEIAVADTVLRNLSTMYEPVVTIDSTKSTNFWRITKRTGEIVPAYPDTFLTDYFNRTDPDGYGVSVAHLGNLGLPMESRIFFEREDRSDFMFMDPYWPYAKRPDKFNFMNTRIPRSNISYQTAGSRQNKEERLQPLLAMNYGKKINFGIDIDYLYSRGFYASQASKHIEWVLFGNYISDRHQLHLYINPANYTNGENGGLDGDGWVTRPDTMGQSTTSKNFPTRFTDTWNHLKGNRYYLNYHYNLGFERTAQTDEEGNEIKQFVPVSSIIYTFDYDDRTRKFYTENPTAIDSFYNKVDHLSSLRKDTTYINANTRLRDSTSYYSVRNTLGLSLREGFSEWAKFDLTAFITQDIRGYTLMDTIVAHQTDTTIFFESYKRTQNSTYIGGELAKRTGKILRYNAQGSIGIAGYNAGDFNVSGNIETRIPFLKDTASVIANGYIKNTAPTFYENHYHSKYFWWSNDFKKTRKVHIGGTIDIPHTRTSLGIGVENITNYIYFDETGYPKQYTGDIQILAASLKQNFKLGALHWDNQVVYQTSSEQDIIPLPDLNIYSSLYLNFVIAKVLTIQMGANAHYWSKYYSPTYEPATQQFRLQKETKVGDYPLINGFFNCHLKQTRFFIEYYNLGSLLISPPNYFSIPHYPVNPPVLKLGLSVDFFN